MCLESIISVVLDIMTTKFLKRQKLSDRNHSNLGFLLGW